MVVLATVSYGAYIAAAAHGDYGGGVSLIAWLFMCLGAALGTTVCIIGPLSGLIGYLGRVRGVSRKKQAGLVLALTYLVPIVVTLVAGRGHPGFAAFIMPLIASTYFAVGYLCFWGVYFRKQAVAS